MAEVADELRADANGDVVTASSATATSTTPTSAPSSAGSAPSRRVRCRSTCAATRICSTSTRSSAESSRPSITARPRSAFRAASIPTSTATTTSTAGPVKEVAPSIHVHGFTALEVTERARRLEMPLTDYLRAQGRRPRDAAGNSSGEILDDEVRAVICPDKVNTEEWLRSSSLHTRVGLRSNVTIMLGTVERPIHVARHLVRAATCEGDRRLHRVRPAAVRAHGDTDLPATQSRPGPTFREVLLVHAVGRIAYRGWIDNVQASWVKTRRIRRAADPAEAGANDLGGTLMDENISRAAGANHGQELDGVGVPRDRRADRPHARATHDPLRSHDHRGAPPPSARPMGPGLVPTTTRSPSPSAPNQVSLPV